MPVKFSSWYFSDEKDERYQYLYSTAGMWCISGMDAKPRIDGACVYRIISSKPSFEIQ